MGRPDQHPATSGGYNYPVEPRQQVTDLIGLLGSPASVLDIGAGFGNNAVPLLEAGHNVTATETNRECIAYLQDLATRYPGKLTVVEAPIQQLDTTKVFDAVVCTMVLHFLKNNEAERAIAAMKDVTSDGGYNVITSYLAGQNLSEEYTWLLESGALPESYKDWSIVSYEESRPFTLDKVRSVRQLARWLLGRRGYKSARLIAKR